MIYVLLKVRERDQGLRAAPGRPDVAGEQAARRPPEQAQVHDPLRVPQPRVPRAGRHGLLQRVPRAGRAGVQFNK